MMGYAKNIIFAAIVIVTCLLAGFWLGKKVIDIKRNNYVAGTSIFEVLLFKLIFLRCTCTLDC